ncbi:MAG: tRNA lysidine(34) synthetase TilS [Chitinophagaceae bacterium]|nr:tRNA lysidine(34) synthetase TilS [Chitinophagaceae bacterium]
MLQRFISFFKEHNLLHPSIHFQIATSGGIDSVTLCELSKQAGLNFSIAHCNFQLRGSESKRDEVFVRTLGDRYNVEVFVKHFQTNQVATEKKLSVQEAARELRYEWFEELRKKKNAAYTLLAHHANDNVETLLMNFFRGTGLQGLTGIKASVPKYHCLRPMLQFTRAEIEQFAKEYQLQWVEDSSNFSSKYTRNFIRNELMQELKKIFPEVQNNLLNNIERFEKINKLYEILVTNLKKKLCKKLDAELRIPILQLMNYQHTSLIYDIIKDYGFGEKQVHEVIKLAEADSGKYIANDEYQIIKHRQWFIIAPKAEAAETIIIEPESKCVKYKNGAIQLKWLPSDKFQLNRSSLVAQLDAKEIEFPLLLRKRREGDYFYPLGLGKKKKLSRFLIDQKLSKNEKENIWVIESAKRILWVVGYRIDDRFKITGSTKEILQLTATL